MLFNSEKVNNVGKTIVPPEGSKDAKLVIVGEYPGATEVKRMRPS